MSQELNDVLVEGALREASVDRSQNLIQGVALLHAVSQNGRIYSENALNDAVELYRNTKVFVDHPTRREMKARDGVRTVHDLAGRIVRAYRSGETVKGDIKLLDREPTKSLFLAVAEAPDVAGMSHRARGQVSLRDDGTQVVAGLDEVFGVDLVTEPATVTNFFESLDRETREAKEEELNEALRERDVPEEVIESAGVVIRHTANRLLASDCDQIRVPDSSIWGKGRVMSEAEVLDELADFLRPEDTSFAESWRDRRRRLGRSGGGSSAAKQRERDPFDGVRHRDDPLPSAEEMLSQLFDEPPPKDNGRR